MESKTILLVAACVGFVAGCTATVPMNLASARDAYRISSEGATAEVASTALHTAGNVLALAERAFVANPRSYQTYDLAYVALRKIQLADAIASIAIEKEKSVRWNNGYKTTRKEIFDNKQQKMNQSTYALKTPEPGGDFMERELNELRKDLVAPEPPFAYKTATQLAAAQIARAVEDKRAVDARIIALSISGVVQNESRGLVISLSGRVLFGSNKFSLLPSAQVRLKQIVDVLLTNRDRHIIIEGHTDSLGSVGSNMELSQRRADSVRDFFVRNEYEATLIDADGMGEKYPVADNRSADGRASNRRVEIIVERETGTSDSISFNE